MPSKPVDPRLTSNSVVLVYYWEDAWRISYPFGSPGTRQMTTLDPNADRVLAARQHANLKGLYAVVLRRDGTIEIDDRPLLARIGASVETTIKRFEKQADEYPRTRAWALHFMAHAITFMLAVAVGLLTK